MNLFYWTFNSLLPPMPTISHFKTTNLSFHCTLLMYLTLNSSLGMYEIESKSNRTRCTPVITPLLPIAAIFPLQRRSLSLARWWAPSLPHYSARSCGRIHEQGSWAFPIPGCPLLASTVAFVRPFCCSFSDKIWHRVGWFWPIWPPSPAISPLCPTSVVLLLIWG